MKPEDVTNEMYEAATDAMWTDSESRNEAIAAAINAMPQSDAQAQIDALKAERDELREFADLMGWTDEMIQREVAITRAVLAKETP